MRILWESDTNSHPSWAPPGRSFAWSREGVFSATIYAVPALLPGCSIRRTKMGNKPGNEETYIPPTKGKIIDSKVTYVSSQEGNQTKHISLEICTHDVVRWWFPHYKWNGKHHHNRWLPIRICVFSVSCLVDWQTPAPVGITAVELDVSLSVSLGNLAYKDSHV